MSAKSRIESDKDLRSAAIAFFSEAALAMHGANRNLSDSPFGYRLSPLGRYEFTEGLLRYRDAVVRRCIDLIGPNVVDEDAVEASLWYAVDNCEQKKTAFLIFCRHICDTVNGVVTVILPNHQLRLAEGIDGLHIGPVRAVSGEKLAGEINRRIANPNWRVEVWQGESGPTRPSGHAIVDAMCWQVAVRASQGNVEPEAVWLVNVATCLLRLLYPVEFVTGYFPIPGDVEPMTGARPQFRRQRIVERDDVVEFGRWGVPKHYQVTNEVLSALRKKGFDRLALSLFEAAENTLGERVARGLGWLTRARQSENRAERYLYIFTALETLLTRDEKSAPIIETIARSAAVLLTNDMSERVNVAKWLRKAYEVRSQLVHAGHRKVSTTDAVELQILAEKIYRSPLYHSDLAAQAERFHAELATASFGLQWPLASN